jgi:homoserine dehydrogenase
VALAFEAAVAGGIPIIKALREGLAANRISASTASSTAPATTS